MQCLDAKTIKVIVEIEHQEDDNQHDENEDKPDKPFGHGCIGVFGHDHRWILGTLGKCAAKTGIDNNLGVDGPSIGIQYRSEVAATQLNPRQHHRGT